MATVTTATVVTAPVQPWKTPQPPGPAPFGQVIYRDNTTIPAVGVGDDSLYTVTYPLPTNFAYRVVEMGFQARSTANAELAKPSELASWLVAIGGVSLRFGTLYNATAFRQRPDATVDAQLISLSATNDFAMEYMAQFLPTEIFLANTPASTAQIQTSWVNPTASTNAIQVLSHCRVLAYTIEQANEFFIYL